jgi:hypothetical protein
VGSFHSQKLNLRKVESNLKETDGKNR